MKLYSFFAAGVQFRHEYKQNMDRIATGDSVFLHPEPDNKYDPGAIKLMWYDNENGDHKHIGYVPKDKNGITTQAELLAFLAKSAHYVRGEVLQHSPANKTWLALEIGVTVTEASDGPADPDNTLFTIPEEDRYPTMDNTFDAMQEERLWPTVEDEDDE